MALRRQEVPEQPVEKPNVLPSVRRDVFAAEVEFFGNNGQNFPKVSTQQTPESDKKAS